MLKLYWKSMWNIIRGRQKSHFFLTKNRKLKMEKSRKIAKIIIFFFQSPNCKIKVFLFNLIYFFPFNLIHFFPLSFLPSLLISQLFHIFYSSFPSLLLILNLEKKCEDIQKKKNKINLRQRFSLFKRSF